MRPASTASGPEHPLSLCEEKERCLAAIFVAPFLRIVYPDVHDE